MSNTDSSASARLRQIKAQTLASYHAQNPTKREGGGTRSIDASVVVARAPGVFPVVRQMDSKPAQITPACCETPVQAPPQSGGSQGAPPQSGGVPLAPVLTSVIAGVTSVDVTFTQAANGTGPITNYKYSLNGQPFVALSPADTSSPITISGLDPTTDYSIELIAVNANGDSVESNTLDITTYTTLTIDSFTTPGTYTWTAPNDVSSVQYLVVGGGGGGGATYSKILVLGDVPVSLTAPVSGYWINKAATGVGGRFNGRLYEGTMGGSKTFSEYVRINASENLTPSDTNYVYNRWYAGSIVYRMTSSFPTTTNYFPPYTITTERCNSHSGGSGGGAGGRVRTSTHTVSGGTSYTVIVGDGGLGGVGGSNTETAGSAGGNSQFDTIVSEGGSGGSHSRNGATTTNGWSLRAGGKGGQTNDNFFGGSGGQGLGSGQDNYGLYNSGGAGGFGQSLNFTGSGATSYGGGGPGGVPNTVATITSPVNVGRGGSGTGANLNSYANGMNGGSGVVMIKYYT
jgi:hypothetical protein